MKNTIYILLLLLISCQANTGKKNPNETYKLTINPTTASTHFYDIVNETNLEMEVEGKDIENTNKSTIGVAYKVAKDSAGNFIVDLTYDKIHLYTKNGETETELNADNASVSLNPIEKMLGVLKGAKLTAIITPKGETKEIKGYKELSEKLTAGFDPNDTYGKTMARQQWEKMIGQKLVNSNLDQLFKIFPDSLVHIGDQWKITSTQQEHVNLNLVNTYTLKDIEGDIATIDVKGEAKSGNTNNNIMGQNVVVDLEGTQEGEYKVNIKTGMPVSSTIASNIEGKIQAAGKEIPLVIKNKVTMKSRND